MKYGLGKRAVPYGDCEVCLLDWHDCICVAQKVANELINTASDVRVSQIFKKPILKTKDTPTPK